MMVIYPSEKWIRDHIYSPYIRFNNPYFWWRLEVRDLTIRDIDEVLNDCKIIEVQRHFIPIRLLLNGYTQELRPVHIAFSVNPTPMGGWWLDAVTCYEPQPPIWETPAKRSRLKAA